jgi:hypothetical protein
VGRGIPRENRTCPDEGVVTNRYPAHHDDARTERCTPLHKRCRQLATTALDESPRMQVVRENHPGTDEDVVLDGHAFEQQDSVLDGHSIADDHAALDVGVIANVAVIANVGITQHMDESPDSGSAPDGVTFAKSQRMYKHIVLDKLPHRTSVESLRILPGKRYFASNPPSRMLLTSLSKICIKMQNERRL